MLLFGDFKQDTSLFLTGTVRHSVSITYLLTKEHAHELPPSTSEPPFVRLPSVFEYFDFRTLKENRRVIKSEDGSEDRKAALENFHLVLMNISEGKATKRVRDFIVQAYVRGALSCGGSLSAELAPALSLPYAT